MTDRELESYAFQCWREWLRARKAEEEERDRHSVLNAIPCQELGREEIDPDTWRP